jgi:outer membrane protein assembly factor BamB
MGKIATLTLVALGGLLLTACSGREGQASPTEWTYRADPQRTGHHLTNGLEVRGELAWRFQTGDEVHSSPGIANGKVFFGSDDSHIYALDAYTGKEQWKVKTGDKVRSSPAVKDGVVYVGSGDFVLYSLDAANGQEKWQSKTYGYFHELDRKGICCEEYLKTDLQGTGSVSYLRSMYIPEDYGVISSPIISDNVVIFGSQDLYVYTVYTSTGEVAWSYRTPSDVSAPPAIKDGVLYLFTDGGSIISMSPRTNQRENWRTHVTFDWSAAGPVIGDKSIYVADHEYLYAINLATGETMWKVETDDSSQLPALANGLVYFGSGKHLYAVDAERGEEKWRATTKANLSTPPTIADGVVYIGDSDGTMRAFDAADGKVKWTYNTGSEITTGPAIADGLVYFGCKDGHVYALK